MTNAKTGNPEGQKIHSPWPGAATGAGAGVQSPPQEISPQEQMEPSAKTAAKARVVLYSIEAPPKIEPIWGSG